MSLTQSDAVHVSIFYFGAIVAGVLMPLWLLINPALAGAEWTWRVWAMYMISGIGSLWMAYLCLATPGLTVQAAVRQIEKDVYTLGLAVLPSQVAVVTRLIILLLDQYKSRLETKK